MRQWTPEQRKRQSEMIRTWKPWRQSIGPRTAAGKRIVSKNAYRGGYWLRFKNFKKIVYEQVQAQMSDYDNTTRENLRLKS